MAFVRTPHKLVNGKHSSGSKHSPPNLLQYIPGYNILHAIYYVQYPMDITFMLLYACINLIAISEGVIIIRHIGSIILW